MPLVRIDMHSALADQRAAFSAAINKGLVEGLEMPADDLFQIFRLHDEGDLVYSPTFTDAERTDIIYLQILLYKMYTPEIKQRACRRVVDELVLLGVKPDNVLIALTENSDGDWYAPTVATHSAALVAEGKAAFEATEAVA
jgi:hypothetical protein